MRWTLILLVALFAGCSKSGDDKPAKYDRALQRYNAEVERLHNLESLPEPILDADKQDRTMQIGLQMERIKLAEKALQRVELEAMPQ